MRDIAPAIEVLHRAGILNPIRLSRLIKDSIALLDLDLRDRVILTEAASGMYVVTPVIAALAGAKVMSITAASVYATTEEVIAQTRALECLCQVENPVEIHTEKIAALFAQADIITNLGFLRPIDASLVKAFRSKTVVALMYEAWEYRQKDLDAMACRAQGIPVVGTNEEYPGFTIFSYCGFLAVKMLLDIQIEIHKSRILVLSADKFGTTIQGTLRDLGATVFLHEHASSLTEHELAGIDALIVADYRGTTLHFDRDSHLNAARLAQLRQDITIIHFAGRLDFDDLAAHGIVTAPAAASRPGHMARTLAYLGPRPVIELHTAGLKVGELTWKVHQTSRSLQETEDILEKTYPLCQPLRLENPRNA